MRYSTGFVVLLVGPLLAGCDKPTLPDSSGKVAQDVRIPEGLNERHAANYLAGAKHLQEIGASKQAAATLKELIAKYPESGAANEAKQILAALEKSNVDAGNDEDGGTVTNPDRDTAEKLLTELPKVKSAKEEEKLLSEFSTWLRENDYKVIISEIDGVYEISCPYFPPETPWVRYAFLDKNNLALLPQTDGDG